MNDPEIIKWLNSSESHMWRVTNYYPVSILMSVKEDSGTEDYLDDIIIWAGGPRHTYELNAIHSHAERAEIEVQKVCEEYIDAA